MTVSTLGIRVVSFVLFGSCAYLAVGGAFLSSAEVYFKLDHYDQAAVYSKRSLAYDRDNSRGLYVFGLSCWMDWLKTKNPETLAQAQRSFKKLTRYHPQYAKGWFYKALAEKQRLLGLGVLTVKDRLRINQEFEKAQALEPSSPWMMIHTSLERLEILPENLKGGAETRLFFGRLGWALQQHYADQASPYLEEVYLRLLKLGYDSHALRKVTPKEAESYFRLLEFYKSKRLYEAYSQSEPEYRVLRRRQISRLCDQADSWLESGDTRRAEAAYRFALSKLPLDARAKAGQLSASRDDNQIGVGETLRSLESLLVQEEEDLSFYWDYLERRVQASRDPFLEGLYRFRRGQYSEAISAFEKVHAEEHLTVRRFLAQSLIEMERLEQARLVLKPLLSEDQPDIRELLLLERLADINSMAENQQIHEKIQKAVTHKILNPAWWSETVGASPLLDEGQLSGVSVNFQPGRVKAGILLKLEAGTLARLARVRIWENDRELFSGTAVVTPHWQRSHLEFETTGGWRWVQVMLEEDSLSDHKKDGAAKMRLGALQMDYPE